MAKNKLSEMQRFLNNLPTRPTDGSCWEWLGGRFRIHGKWQYGCFVGKQGIEGAHRASYRLFKGPIPKGKCVLHSCDNPACCHPEHLRVGTKTENAKERDTKGRGCPPGHPDHPQTKMLPEAVGRLRRDARRLALQRGSLYGVMTYLTKHYPVGQAQICKLCKGVVPDDFPKRRPAGPYSPL